MADYLQPPPNSTLHKRKSDNDLSEEVARERNAVHGAVLQKKDNWVHKGIRVRSRYYCCYCREKQVLEKGSCKVCRHETTDCSECLAGRTSRSNSGKGETASKADEARYKEALRELHRERLHIPHEEKQQKLDDMEFNADQHLIFSPPQNTWSLADMELQYDDSVTSFAVSGNFPLFSAEAIIKMQEELLNDTFRHKFRKTGIIVNYQLRGMVPDHAKFTYNAWNCSETLAAISKVVGTDLIPVMDLEISHVNILFSGNNVYHPVQWHRDDYPYVCVLMLSDTTYMEGGEILLRTGSGGILTCDSPKMGFAYILNGRHVEHAVNSFKGCTDRITAVTALRPRSPFVQDQTQLCNVRAVSNHTELSYQFVQYRWDIAIERLTALRQMLKGKEVRGWMPYRSTLLVDNLEGIQRFLLDTSTQVCIPSPTCTTRVSSYISTIKLRVGYPPQGAHHCDVGLRYAVEALEKGLREQQRVAEFDHSLVQSTAEYVVKVLGLYIGGHSG